MPRNTRLSHKKLQKTQQSNSGRNANDSTKNDETVIPKLRLKRITQPDGTKLWQIVKDAEQSERKRQNENEPLIVAVPGPSRTPNISMVYDTSDDEILNVNRLCITPTTKDKRPMRTGPGFRPTVKKGKPVAVAVENENNAAVVTADVQEPIVQELTAEEQRLIYEAQQLIVLDDRLEFRRRNMPNQMNTYLIAYSADVHQNNLGPCTFPCPHCEAMHFQAEQNANGLYKDCCELGKVQLQEQQDVPARLLELYTTNGEEARHFRQRSITYNNALCFASVCVSEIHNPNFLGATGFYKIQGQFVHYIHHVNPLRGRDQYHAQNPGRLYFLDANTAFNERIADAENRNCRPALLQQLENLIRNINPFAQAYSNLREVAADRPHDTVTLRLLQTRNRHINPPLINEVAVIFEGNYLGAMENYELRVYARQGHRVVPRPISILNSNCDPLCYPLLFAHGEPGYACNVPHTRGPGKVSMREYYLYRKNFRSNERNNQRRRFNVYIDCGRLSHKLIVDAYVKVENERMDFILRNQHLLRGAGFNDMEDYLNVQANERDLPLGRVIILPSTFQGSPRNCLQNYQDAIAILAKFGKPDMFITFTCNPQWPEIRENLHAGQQSGDRPDLINRVFHLKLKELLLDINRRHVFGVTTAYLYVIEFQKRGLPHAHLLMWLREQDKFREPEDVDLFVCSEIPHPQHERELYEKVQRQMIHGPCFPLNEHALCRGEDGRCTKKFPKEFCEQTMFVENSYPQYRRRNDGRTIRKAGAVLDNRHVVPYNKYLLNKYDSHVNVEICSSLRSLKYIFKYVYKGYDTVRVQLRREQMEDGGEALEHNEVETYVDQRYVSINEADWRINAFPMHDKSHAIYRLDVHLRNEQYIYFRQGNEEAAANLARQRNTTLTAWLQLNVNDHQARQFLYQEIPLHYVFNKTDYRWTRRIRGADKIIPRMYSVSPRNKETFYLRMLLLHVRGATSFADVRTVNGIVYDTFEAACRARNILQDNGEYRRCLEEARLQQMPRQMRVMFAMMLLNCNLTNANELWQQFKSYIYEDHTRRGDNANTAEIKALRHITTILRANDRHIEEFEIALPDNMQHAITIDDEGNDDEHIMAHVDDLERDIANEMNLNEEQRAVFDAVVETVADPLRQPRLFYVDGPGGTGKTFLYNAIISKLTRENVPVLATAWTGIASTLLKTGRTVHSTFQLPVPTIETSTSALTPQNGQRFVHVSAIIIDEISMASKYALHCIDEMLKNVCGDGRPFANKVIILGGDFRQLLPISTGIGGSGPSFNLCVKRSPLWERFHRMSLVHNVRANPDENEFKEWLLRIGNATENQVAVQRQLPPEYVSIPARCLVRDVVTEIYGEHVNVDDATLQQKIILCPKNDSCDELNERILNRARRTQENGIAIAQPIRTYMSADSVVTENEEVNFPVEFLNTVKSGTLPPHQLKICEGSIVILLRNLAIDQGLYNGTRLQIVRMLDNMLHAKIVSGSHVNDEVFIPRMDLTTTADRNVPFQLKRRQFPIKLAFAMTINKAQGQTFDRVGIYLPQPVFVHGMLYVALSRARSYDAVKIQIDETRSQGKLLRAHSPDVFTKNIVYLDALH